MDLRRAAVIGISLAGLVLCAVKGFGGDVLCLTRGCAVYARYTILGLTMPWWGVMAFAGVGLGAAVPFLWDRARLLPTIMLAVDILLLLYLAVFAPCTFCLAVGIVIAAVFVAAGGVRGWRGWLLGAWAILAVINGADAFHELVRPWPVYGDPAKAGYEVYFSMDCPACRQTLQELLKIPGMDQDVTLYPVVKNSHDEEMLGRLDRELKGGKGLGAALDAAWGGQAPGNDEGSAGRLLLRLRTELNKSILFRQGYGTVPIVIAKNPRFEQGSFAMTPRREPQAGVSQKPVQSFAPAPALPALNADSTCKEDRPGGCEF